MILKPAKILKASTFLLAAALLTSTAASAQAVVDTPLQKFLAKVDLGVNGVGLFNTTVKGPILAPGPNFGTLVTEQPSNTFGALTTLRYIRKPYLGFEANYGYARYTENFTTAPGGVQTNVNEETLGYVVTPPHTLYGFQPVISVGGGTSKFMPTARGGEGLPKQYRATYYYNVGIQNEYFSHVGFRAFFRESFFIAPDFLANYLTIKQRTTSIEPGVGFYVRF